MSPPLQLLTLTPSAITSVASALHWLRSTFLFVRIKRNPKFYALPGSEDVSPATRIEEICISAVGSLVSSDIVEEQQDSDLLTPTGPSSRARCLLFGAS